MRNQKNNKILWFIAMFVIMSFAAYAQDSSTSSSSSSYPSSQSGSINSSSQSFNDDARQLSSSLVQQLGLSQDKSDKISQILTDYRSDIVDARNKFIEKRQDQSKNPDVTGGQSRVDMTGILGDNVDQYYVEATPDLMSDYKDADKKADSKIKDALDDQASKDKYDQIKGQWWGDVKNKVFTSLSQNSQQNPQQPMK